MPIYNLTFSVLIISLQIFPNTKKFLSCSCEISRLWLLLVELQSVLITYLQINTTRITSDVRIADVIRLVHASETRNIAV